jgi:hypothetical protein
MSKNIAADLQKLLKRASESKTELVKKAEDSGPATAAEGAVGKTESPTSGTQLAGTMAEAKATQTAAAVDNGAKTNPVGGSVANSTEGAAASSVNGQSGAKAPGEMGSTVDKTTVNADVMGAPAPNSDSGSFKSARAESIRAIAASLHKAAAELLSPMDKFLAKAARANPNPQIKKAAEGMDDKALADASAGSIDDQIQSGQIDDATAAQILQEALAEGAITKEELMAAAQELQGGDAGGAAGGDAGGAPGGDAPSGDDTAAADPAAMAGGDAGGEPAPDAAADNGSDPMAMDPNAAAKVAMAHIDSNHPDYVQKLARAYPQAMQQGFELFQVCHSDLVKQAASATAEAPKTVKVAEASDIVANSDEEKTALAAAAGQLGLSSEQLGALVSAKTPAMDKTAAYRAQLLTKIAALG